MKFNNIETKRLILRPITEADTLDFFELDSDPEVHLYLGNEPVIKIEESQAMVVSILQQYKTHGIGRLAIVEKSTNHFIGWAGLKYEKDLRNQFNYYDLGTRIKEQYWGKGYATEAAMASLDSGFNVLKLTEIGAVADINNMASNTILKKIGMHAQDTFKHNGEVFNWYIIKNPNVLKQQNPFSETSLIPTL